MSRNSLKTSVIIPWAEGRSAICAVRSLARKGVRSIAVSSNARAMGFYSKYPSEKFVIPPYGTQLSQHRDALLELCKRNDVLTIMPFVEADAYLLSTQKEALKQYVKPVWVSSETFECVRDKTKLVQKAQRAGVPVPKTSELTEWTDWSTPCVIKSRYSIMEAGNGLFYGGVEFADPNKRPDFEAIRRRMRHDPIVQEYIRGPEFGFSALFNDGQPRAMFQHLRILSESQAGGASVLRKSIFNKELGELGMKLLRALHWHGPAMVEFKFDEEEGKFKLMEINPRFWGSLNLAIEAGVDFPYLYYKLARDGDCESVLTYRTNVVAHYLPGELRHLANVLQDREPSYVWKNSSSLKRDVFRIISMLRHSEFDVLDRHDMAPLLVDILSTLKIFRN